MANGITTCPHYSLLIKCLVSKFHHIFSEADPALASIPFFDLVFIFCLYLICILMAKVIIWQFPILKTSIKVTLNPQEPRCFKGTTSLSPGKLIPRSPSFTKKRELRLVRTLDFQLKGECITCLCKDNI